MRLRVYLGTLLIITADDERLSKEEDKSSVICYRFNENVPRLRSGLEFRTPLNCTKKILL